MDKSSPFSLGEWIEKVILEKERLSTENKDLRAAVTRLTEENSRLRSYDETERMRRHLASLSTSTYDAGGSESITKEYNYNLTKDSRTTDYSYHDLEPHQHRFDVTQLKGKPRESPPTVEQQGINTTTTWPDIDGSIGRSGISERDPVATTWTPLKYYDGDPHFSPKSEVHQQVPPAPGKVNLSSPGALLVAPSPQSTLLSNKPMDRWHSSVEGSALKELIAPDTTATPARQYSQFPGQLSSQKPTRAQMSEHSGTSEHSSRSQSWSQEPQLPLKVNPSPQNNLLCQSNPGALDPQSKQVQGDNDSRSQPFSLYCQQPLKLNSPQQIPLDRSNETKLVKRAEKWDFEVKRGQFVKDPSGRYVFKFTIPLGPAARTYYYLLENAGHETKKLRKRFKCAVHVSRIPLISGGPVGMKDFQAFIELSSESEVNVKQAAQEILRAVNSMPDTRKRFPARRYEVKFPPPPYVAQAVRDRLLNAGGAVIKRLMTENNCHIYCQRAKGKIDILVGSDSERNFQKGVEAVLGVVDSMLKDGSKMYVEKVGNGYEVYHRKPEGVVGRDDTKEQSFIE